MQPSNTVRAPDVSGFGEAKVIFYGHIRNKNLPEPGAGAANADFGGVSLRHCLGVLAFFSLPPEEKKVG